LTRVISDVDPIIARLEPPTLTLEEILRGSKFTEDELAERLVKFIKPICECGGICPCHKEEE